MGPGFESLCVHHEKLLARTTKCGLKIFQCLAVARQILGMIFFVLGTAKADVKHKKHHPMGGVFIIGKLRPDCIYNLYIQIVLSAGASSCAPNTINITWEDAAPESVAANNAGSCTYGGTINTPAVAPSKRGYIFTGWSFD